jgi:hypothetical protein
VRGLLAVLALVLGIYNADQSWYVARSEPPGPNRLRPSVPMLAGVLLVEGRWCPLPRGCEDGELLDIGRRTRAIPPAIGRALWLRDGGCRVPGCGRRHYLHAHHIEGWADGGATKLSNLVLVCSGHHRMLHEGRLAAEVSDRNILFIDQKGRAMPGVPPSAATGHDLEELEFFLHEAELHIDASTSLSRWDGTKVPIAEMLQWIFIAEQTGALQCCSRWPAFEQPE